MENNNNESWKDLGELLLTLFLHPGGLLLLLCICSMINFEFIQEKQYTLGPGFYITERYKMYLESDQYNKERKLFAEEFKARFERANIKTN